MNRVEALELLDAKSQSDRLAAARGLSRMATEADLPRLKTALRAERIPWIRSALEASVARAAVGSSAPVETVDVPRLATEDAIASEVYARATEELTDRFVHEIRPLLGLARVYASREIKGYVNSKTASVLTQMQEALRAIDTLGRAAAAPKMSEFDVAELVREVASNCEAELESGGTTGTSPSLDGPDPLLTSTDRDLVGIALRNGIRNAFEASASTSEPVVVSWGQSSSELWIAVLDFGEGLSSDSSGLFTLGTTTKDEHLGMGLAIAERAVATLGGTLSLAAQPDRSTRFELLLPRLAT
jgi:signal transduction histidine kinase